MIKVLWLAAMALTASCVANDAGNASASAADEELTSTQSEIEAPVPLDTPSAPASTCVGKCERIGCEEGEVPGAGTCKPGVCCVRSRT